MSNQTSKDWSRGTEQNNGNEVKKQHTVIEFENRDIFSIGNLTSVRVEGNRKETHPIFDTSKGD